MKRVLIAVAVVLVLVGGALAFEVVGTPDGASGSADMNVASVGNDTVTSSITAVTDWLSGTTRRGDAPIVSAPV